MPLTFVPHPRGRRPVTLWLLLTALAVFAMILLGGATRLTGSGLSMVEWRPLTGVLPPMNQTSWEEEFEKYKAHSEFQQVNSHMTLREFKSIYYLEYVHRLWGRLLGVLLLLPLGFFWIKGWLSRPLIRHVLVTFALGGLQGAMGWVMVKSGLGADPHVSPFKLAGHLLLAVWILWRLLWAATGVYTGQVFKVAKNGPFPLLLPLALGVFTYGALVAGHQAGYLYNTFPLMGGDLIPTEIGHLGWLDAVQNPVTVQWIHRWLALLLVASVAFALAKSPREAVDRRWLKGLLHLGFLQAALGITTLLTHVSMAVALGHQACGVLLVLTVLAGAHRVGPLPKAP